MLSSGDFLQQPLLYKHCPPGVTPGAEKGVGDVGSEGSALQLQQPLISMGHLVSMFVSICPPNSEMAMRKGGNEAAHWKECRRLTLRLHGLWGLHLMVRVEWNKGLEDKLSSAVMMTQKPQLHSEEVPSAAQQGKMQELAGDAVQLVCRAQVPLCPGGCLGQGSAKYSTFAAAAGQKDLPCSSQHLDASAA